MNAGADCVTDAASYHHVNDNVLRAILWNESRMNGKAVNKNSDGSLDVGIAQINSKHFDELRRLGVAPETLLEPCVGTYVAGWHLSKQIARYGNTWQGIGAYHSATPIYNQAYANSIAITLSSWKLLDAGYLPFPGAPRSSGDAQRQMRGQASQRPGQSGGRAIGATNVERSSSIIAITE